MATAVPNDPVAAAVEASLPQRTEPAAIPPRPEPPLPTDCCGSGCVRCVNDIYAEELEDWERRYGSAPS